MKHDDTTPAFSYVLVGHNVYEQPVYAGYHRDREEFYLCVGDVKNNTVTVLFEEEGLSVHINNVRHCDE